MGKTAKILGAGLVLIIAAVVIVFTVVLQNLDDIIKAVIEKVGSDVAKTEVTVSSVEFTLQEGRGVIRGLKIANPPGYQSSHAFAMNEVAVQIEPGSLSGPVIVINEVTIDGATLVAEQKGLGTNLKELLDGMNAGAEPAQPAPADTAPAGEEVHLMMEAFNFTGTEASLVTSQWGERSLSVPDIKMTNIGDKETGLTPVQLANRMVKNVLKQVEKAVAKELEKLAKDAAQEALESKLSEKEKKQLEGVKSLFKKD